VPAIKAALHRGRSRLRELAAVPEQEAAEPTASPALARYAALFNARDWDGVRAMLVDDGNWISYRARSAVDARTSAITSPTTTRSLTGASRRAG
jgi:hypothetical protein